MSADDLRSVRQLRTVGKRWIGKAAAIVDQPKRVRQRRIVRRIERVPSGRNASSAIQIDLLAGERLLVAEIGIEVYIEGRDVRLLAGRWKQRINRRRRIGRPGCRSGRDEVGQHIAATTLSRHEFERDQIAASR